MREFKVSVGSSLRRCMACTHTHVAHHQCLRSIPPTEPWHPSIINFDDLLLTPRYLCLIMPYYEHPMQVCVPLSTCRNYFEKLASAVSWLHRHYITHNDIKLVNTVVRVTDEDWDGTPVIVG